MIGKKPKTFADCAIYSKADEAGYSTERALITFIMSADRIDISSGAFKGVVEQLKSRSQSAVVVRMLQQGNVVLGIAAKELSPSLKVFYAKDIKASTKSRKVFVDVTNLIKLENGFFVCNNIDKFAAYLLGVLVMQTYYTDPNKYITNGNLQKLSVTAFIKLFCAILNDQRMPGYISNKAKIQYISGVYFGVSVMGLDMNAARLASMASLKLGKQEAANIDYYYTEADFKNIYIFLEYLIKTFKLKDLAPDGFINKWIYSYGKGTMYALELYPSFLILVLYAYSGSYINNMKRIENTISKELVDISTTIIRIGNDSFSRGFKYESQEDRRIYERNFHEFYEERGIDINKIIREAAKDIDPAEISKEGIQAEDKDQGTKTPGEVKAYVDSIKNDAGLDAVKEGFMDKLTNKPQDPNMQNAVNNLNKSRQQMQDTIKSIDDDVRKREEDLRKFKQLANKQKQMIQQGKSAASSVNETTDDLDAHEISKDGSKSEQNDQGTKTPEEANTLEKEIKSDAPMNEGFFNKEKPRRLTWDDYAKIDIPQPKKKEEKEENKEETKHESGELDPNNITKEAINKEKEDTPNNGEVDDLLDDIVKDIVLK